jgi:hypothetical protein
VPKVDDQSKEVLPRDFTREVPAVAWKWLLQYGLPYSYWKPITGFTETESRLVLTHGRPIETSVGRFIPSDRQNAGEGVRKWKQWGDKSRSATVLEPKDSGSYEGVVVVEDLISAHKVAQVCHCLPIFGTSLYPKAIQALRALKRPVTLWLDEDQGEVLPRKINRLQTFLDVPVRFVKTRKDPKDYSPQEIKEILDIHS